MATDDSNVVQIKRQTKLEDLASELSTDVNLLKCQLTCAVRALGAAQNEGDIEVAAQAHTALEACVERMHQIEEGFDELEAKVRKTGVAHV